MKTQKHLIAAIALIALTAAHAHAKPGRSVGHKGPAHHASRHKAPSCVTTTHKTHSHHVTRQGHKSHLSLGFSISRPGFHLRAGLIPSLRSAYLHRHHRPALITHPRPVIVPAPLPLPPVQTKVTVWIANANGSQTSVVLIKEGPWYIGPRGERYFSLPTADQLRPLYGLDAGPVQPAEFTIYVTALNGSRVPVTITATADGYIGPKGELYTEMPTEQQLAMIYGR